jgi:membrane protease YdiL (CAAX protease family)
LQVLSPFCFASHRTMGDHPNPSEGSLGNAVKVFAPSCLLILVGVYVVWPRLVDTGMPALPGYLLCFQTIPFLLLFIQLAVYLRRDGELRDVKSVVERLRLRFRWKPVLVGLALFLAGVVSYFVLQPVTRILAETPLFAPPSWFPPDLHPLKASEPGHFMGYAMQGSSWPVAVWVVGWVLNIAGEELLFRGYLLPLQERRHGARAWLVNGVLWNVWHIFWRWQMVAMLPFHLLVPFVAQKSKSTWPGIIAHGLLNFIAIIVLTRAAMGFR